MGLSLLVGCAAKGPRPPASGTTHAGSPSASARAATIARQQIGKPYRYGARGPSRFDCSGLVLYSYARAGVPGLPHSAAALERRVRSVALSALAPGDLIFFRLGGRKARHVAIYLGEGRFVHAPSSGGVVEAIPFDHPYWGPRIRRAGRLAN